MCVFVRRENVCVCERERRVSVCERERRRSKHPETKASRKGLSFDEIVNLLRELSGNESDGDKPSCSNLDSDEDKGLRERDYEQSEESTDEIDATFP
ncbi:hypothetical protein TNCV_4808731 [Trichonephila clavipes]|nr:hypothetical protein TNCV_4808731 [Trichonephila clavipes]